MIRWLVIETVPPQQFHDAAALPYIDPAERAHQVLQSLGTQRSSVYGEVAGVSVILRNAAAECVPILAKPPLGCDAVIYGREGGATVEQFRGVVVRVDLDTEAVIEVRA